MNTEDTVFPYYRKRLAAGYRNYQAVGWESEEAQRMRFAAMADNVGLEGCSLLDVGCGLGHLYEYLSKRGLNIVYVGIDFIPEMIARAQRLYPEVNFFVQDIFAHTPDQPYDYVYASGMFNLRVGDNMALLDRALMHICTLCRRAAVISMLSEESQNIEKEYFYYSSNKVLMLAKRYFGARQVISGYLHNDFTLICRIEN